MVRAKKAATQQPVAPHPDASLLGLPAELRNNIYQMVADDVDEVSIIGRKIIFGPTDAQDRFWGAIAKHPLSQTCRQLRQEFDSIHRHKVMTSGVLHYCLEVEN